VITLYVAEKPSMARDLARALGAKRREGARWEGEGVWVSWCIGHLVQIASPAEHEERWKSWRISELPILPQPLKWVASKRTKSHLKELSGLLRDRRVTQIVNACDAGREGELIFRTVYAHARAQAPVQRFWVSSLTSSAIQAGLRSLRPGADFDPLASAAYCRAESDWLVGMNATRALTSRASDLLSVGRVQTPTLSLLVRREREIQRFVPEDYWTLEAELNARSGERWRAQWRGRHEELSSQPSPQAQRAKAAQGEPLAEGEGEGASKSGRFSRLEDAERVAERARVELGRVMSCEGKERATPPPLLLHLTALQQEANRRYGYSADQCLSYAQALYERHKLISYPRTDSRHLTPDVAATLPKAVAALAACGGRLGADASAVQRGPQKRLGKRFVNAQRVTDHHALVPTSKAPQLEALSEGERRVYELIARSLLMAMSPDALDFVMSLDVDLAGGLWRATGRVERRAGWRAFALSSSKRSGAAEEEQLLPYLEPQREVRALEVELSARQTQPPKPFSEASLLGAMEHAGRQLDERALKEAIKGSGLGTPATRASILETLLKRGYLRREGKLLKPTEAGATLIDAITALSSEASEALCSPALTAHWEQRLQRIADGEEPAAPFMEQVRRWVSALSESLARGPRVAVPQRAGRGARSRAISKGAGRGASGSTGSTGSTGSWRSAQQSPSKGSSKSSPKGSSAEKRSALPEQVAGLSCPLCKQGALLKGSRGWGCGRWREGCAFVLWFEQDGVELPEAEAARVIARKASRLFVERDGKKWRLCLDLSAPRWVRWEAGKARKSSRNTKPSGGAARSKGAVGAQRWKRKR